MSTQLCRTCAYLTLGASQKGFRKGYAYKCGWTARPSALPDSITSAYGFSRDFSQRYMGPDEGTECPTWEPRR